MPDVQYRFIANGQGDVVDAFGSIDAAAARSGANVNRSQNKQQRAQKKTTAVVKRGATEQERAAKRSANARERAEAKASKTIARRRLQGLREFKRMKAAEVRAAEKAAAKEVSVAKRAAEKIAATRRRSLGRIGGRVAGGVGRVAGAAALAAGGLIGASARERVQLADASQRLSIKGSGKVSGDALRRSFEDTAAAVPGAKASDLAAGAERFVAKTGDVEAAQKFSRVIAEISVATGTAAEDLGSAAADIFQKFEGTQTIDQMARAFATLAVQGKRGAFELEDAAAQFPKILSAAQRFGLEGTKGLATVGGLAQIARGGVKGGEDTATAVENLFKELISKSDQIEKKTGAKVFTDSSKNKTRDIQDILVETISGSGGNIADLQKLFGARGIRAVSPLISTFNKTRENTTGTEAEKTAAGIKALRAQLKKSIDATGAEAEMRRDLTSAQQTSSVKITAAWEKVGAAVSESVLPALVPLIESLPRLAASLGPVIDKFATLADLLGDFGDFLSGLPGFEKSAKTLNRESKTRQAGLEQEREVLFDKARTGETLSSQEMAKLNALNESIVTESTGRGAAKKKVEESVTINDFEKKKTGLQVSAALAGGAIAGPGGAAAAALTAGVVAEGSAALAKDQAGDAMGRLEQLGIHTQQPKELKTEEVNLKLASVADALAAAVAKIAALEIKAPKTGGTEPTVIPPL